MGRGYNVYQSREFSFSGLHSTKWLWMGKYCTYLELNASQGAPKHCQTFDSFTQFWSRAQLRSPRGSLEGASKFVNAKLARNMVSLLERNSSWNMVVNKFWGSFEAPLRLLRGDLNCALVQNWVNESKVWQCLGAPWDSLNSRYVPYFTIRSQFWAVRAWKEKSPPLKDSGLPPDFHKKSGGEPV